MPRVLAFRAAKNPSPTPMATRMENCPWPRLPRVPRSGCSDSIRMPILQKGLERRRDLMLADFDANRDGAITRDELSAFVTAEFGKADKDGDGTVNLEESRAYRFVRAEDTDKQSDLARFGKPPCGHGFSVE